MHPYLNVCGQGDQKSKFWAKNIMFWPKIDIFSGPRIFKSGSAVRPHRGLSNEVSHDPIPLTMSMGGKIVQNLSKLDFPAPVNARAHEGPP